MIFAIVIQIYIIMRKQMNFFFLLMIALSLFNSIEIKGQDSINDLSEFYIFTNKGDGTYAISLTTDFKTELDKPSDGSFTVGNYTWVTGDPLPNPLPQGFLDDASYFDMSKLFAECSSMTSLDLTQFDMSRVISLSYTFFNCGSLKILKLDGINTSNVTDMSYMFAGCSVLKSVDFKNLDTSNVTNMCGMFAWFYGFNSLDLSSFDTSSVTDMNFMFYGCYPIRTINLNGFDTSNVTSMYSMFYWCSSLQSLDLSSFDTSNVTDMGNMFTCCSSLKSLDLSNFDTSKVENMAGIFDLCSSISSLDITNFNTSSVWDMSKMFKDCSSLTSLDLKHFDTSNLSSMENMFKGCSSLTALDLSNFQLMSHVNLSNCFSDCGKPVNGRPIICLAKDYSHATRFNDSQRTGIDLSKLRFIYSSNLYRYENSKSGVGLSVSLLDAFKAEINKSSGGSYSYGDEVWRTGDPLPNPAPEGVYNDEQVTDMSNLFANLDMVTSLDLTFFDTRFVNDTHGMFRGCSSISALYLTSFDAMKITYMDDMFSNCGQVINGKPAIGYVKDDAQAAIFNDPQITGIDSQKLVIDASFDLTQFYTYDIVENGYKLALTDNFKQQLDKDSGGRITVGNYTWVTGDPLPNPLPQGFLDYTSYFDMSKLFAECSSMTSLDLTQFDMSRVISLSYTFFNCGSLKILKLDGINTSNVTDMSYMFAGCSVLKSVDFKNLDTSNVTNMCGMFAWFYGFNSLDLSSFDTSSVTDMNFMFYGCYPIRTINLNGFDTSNVTSMYSMFYWCSSLQSLDLSSFDTSNVTDMGNMFTCCSSLKSLDLSNFDTSKVENMAGIFDLCSSISSLDITNFNTSSVWDMSKMFKDCSSLTSLDLKHFDTSNLSSMENMFKGCSSLTALDLSNFQLMSHVNLSNCFSDCGKSVKGRPIIGLAKDASHATRFNESQRTGIDLSKLRFICSSHFYRYEYSQLGTGFAVSLLDTFRTEINKESGGNYNYGELKWKTGDPLPNPAPNGMYDIEPVTDMASLFADCNLAKSLDLSDFNTSQVVSMNKMFSGCSSLIELNLINFDVSKVNNLASMFYNCNSITSLDLSSFELISDISTRNEDRIIELENMFLNCGTISEGSPHLGYAKDQNHADIFNDPFKTAINTDALYFVLPTSIVNPTNNSGIKISTQGTKLVIEGLNKQDISIYSINGTLIYKVANADENITIDLVAYGIYVLKIGNDSYKITM